MGNQSMRFKELVTGRRSVEVTIDKEEGEELLLMGVSFKRGDGKVALFNGGS